MESKVTSINAGCENTVICFLDGTEIRIKTDEILAVFRFNHSCVWDKTLRMKSCDRIDMFSYHLGQMFESEEGVKEVLRELKLAAYLHKSEKLRNDLLIFAHDKLSTAIQLSAIN